MDIHVVGYRALSFGPFIRVMGHTDVGNVVLDEEGALWWSSCMTVMAQPFQARVVPFVDPAGYRMHKRGPLLHGRTFHQRSDTNPSGTVRFAGVPPGRIRIHAATPDGEMRFQGVVAATQTIEIQLAGL